MRSLSLKLPDPWLLDTWPKVAWTPADDDEALGQWTHVRTSLVGRDHQGLQRGETLWVSDLDGVAVGAGWEWVEWRRGVVVLADPMGIVSNLEPPSDAGGAPALTLIRLAHGLGWEWQALSALARARGRRGPPQARPWRPLAGLSAARR